MNDVHGVECEYTHLLALIIQTHQRQAEACSPNSGPTVRDDLFCHMLLKVHLKTLLAEKKMQGQCVVHLTPGILFRNALRSLYAQSLVLLSVPSGGIHP